MTSSIKPEVHNVSQRRHRRSKPGPQGICIKNLVKIGLAVPETCSRTDGHTDRQAYRNTPLPYRGGVKIYFQAVDKDVCFVFTDTCIIILLSVNWFASKLTHIFVTAESTFCQLAAVRARMERRWNQMFARTDGDGMKVLRGWVGMEVKLEADE